MKAPFDFVIEPKGKRYNNTTKIEDKDKYSIYIKKNNDVLPWKDFNKNMAVSIEYNLEY